MNHTDPVKTGVTAMQLSEALRDGRYVLVDAMPLAAEFLPVNVRAFRGHAVASAVFAAPSLPVLDLVVSASWSLPHGAEDMASVSWRTGGHNGSGQPPSTVLVDGVPLSEGDLDGVIRAATARCDVADLMRRAARRHILTVLGYDPFVAEAFEELGALLAPNAPYDEQIRTAAHEIGTAPDDVSHWCSGKEVPPEAAATEIMARLAETVLPRRPIWDGNSTWRAEVVGRSREGGRAILRVRVMEEVGDGLWRDAGICTLRGPFVRHRMESQILAYVAVERTMRAVVDHEFGGNRIAASSALDVMARAPTSAAEADNASLSMNDDMTFSEILEAAMTAALPGGSREDRARELSAVLVSLGVRIPADDLLAAASEGPSILVKDDAGRLREVLPSYLLRFVLRCAAGGSGAGDGLDLGEA